MENNVAIDGNVSQTTKVTPRDVVRKTYVPAGKVLVVTWHGKKPYDGWGFCVYSQGEEVDPKDLKMGKIVHEGQSLAVSACHYSQRGTTAIPKRVYNHGGVAVVKDDHGPGIKFAQDQRAWLRQQGFNEREIDTLMKVARPGQVRAAVKWARDAARRWQEESPDLRERQIEITLAQALKASFGAYGWVRTIKAIEELTGVYAPDTTNAREFFGIMHGAQVALEMGLPIPVTA